MIRYGLRPVLFSNSLSKEQRLKKSSDIDANFIYVTIPNKKSLVIWGNIQVNNILDLTSPLFAGSNILVNDILYLTSLSFSETKHTSEQYSRFNLSVAHGEKPYTLDTIIHAT